MESLKRIKLEGFKSIKSMDLELTAMNILIGANGAGKSNLISFFKLLNEMMGSRLRQHVGACGHASSLLHFGPKVTPQIQASLEFEVERGVNEYTMRLLHAVDDSLVFAEENVGFHAATNFEPTVVSLGVGHSETGIREEAENGGDAAKSVRWLLNRCRVFHFHDTSSTATVRQACYVDDNRWLMPDAGNLAAVLLRLRSERGDVSYRRILSNIRLVAPFFDDFELEPDTSHRVKLNWRHRGSPALFGPHQLSDGTLRAMCLVTLLMLPEGQLPNFIIVDEPELGLHPYALNLVASLFKSVSNRAQVLVSTQSSAFLDSFEPEDVIVANRTNGETRFSRPNSETLRAWLEDYSLGEVWEKNVMEGGPH
ncbi:MAG: AAA family ATPase [Planctomycetota bacterium]